MPGDDSHKNGNGNGLVHVRKFERTAFPVQRTTLDTIINQIKEMGQSGSLTVSFHNGNISGTATFERELKENKS
jgi:hypothetical protein